MTLEELQTTDLWRQFEQNARSKKKSSATLLAEVLREYLESAEDVHLNELISTEARKSGWTQSDAVRLVRRHRTEKKTRRAAS